MFCNVELALAQIPEYGRRLNETQKDNRNRIRVKAWIDLTQSVAPGLPVQTPGQEVLRIILYMAVLLRGCEAGYLVGKNDPRDGLEFLDHFKVTPHKQFELIYGRWRFLSDRADIFHDQVWNQFQGRL